MNILEDHLNNLMIEKIKEYGNKNCFDTVIDLGGKDGKYTSRIAKKLTVVDLAPNKVFDKVKYVEADILEFDTSKKFDLIVSSAFLEHFTKKDGMKILKKMNDFLKNDGLAFITCPNAWSLNRLLGDFMGLGKALDLSDGDIRVGHKYLYNLRRLEDIAKQSLNFIDSGSYFFKPLPASDMNSLFDMNAFNTFASINSNSHPHLKEFLAEIYVVGKKK